MSIIDSKATSMEAMKEFLSYLSNTPEADKEQSEQLKQSDDSIEVTSQDFKNKKITITVKVEDLETGEIPVKSKFKVTVDSEKVGVKGSDGYLSYQTDTEKVQGLVFHNLVDRMHEVIQDVFEVSHVVNHTGDK